MSNAELFKWREDKNSRSKGYHWCKRTFLKAVRNARRNRYSYNSRVKYVQQQLGSKCQQMNDHREPFNLTLNYTEFWFQYFWLVWTWSINLIISHLTLLPGMPLGTQEVTLVLHAKSSRCDSQHKPTDPHVLLSPQMVDIGPLFALHHNTPFP